MMVDRRKPSLLRRHQPTRTQRRSPLVLILVATLLATSSGWGITAATAQAGATLVIEAPSRVAAGEPIELTLRLKQARNVAGYETTLLFDTSVAEFSELDQQDNDLKKLGRDVAQLAVVEVPYGASIGFYTCPMADCIARGTSKNNRGGNGNIKLGTVTLSTNQPGTYEIGFGTTKVVDIAGGATPVTVETPKITIEVGAASPTFRAPANPWSLPTTTSKSPGPVDLTGDGQISNADAAEVVRAWTRLREQGNPCDAYPEPERDVNRDGCIDVADIQKVASSYSTRSGSTTAANAMDVSIASTFVVNSTGDQPDAVARDGICATSVGTCTLRAAIHASNQNLGPDLVTFNLPGSGVQVIQLTKALPTILDESGGTTIDGYSQPGASPNTSATVSNATIMVEVVGAGESQYEGFYVTSANNTIRGLSLYKLNRGIWLYGNGADNNQISGNFVGTNAAGTYRSPQVTTTTSNGVHLQQGASSNLIGGTSPQDRNVLSGNARHGVALYYGGSNANLVYGNLVGLSPNGQSCIGNRIEGIDINFAAKNNVIGGTGTGERNVATGNGLAGVDISHGTGTIGNQVIGNFLGTGVDGKADPSGCGSQRMGVRIEDGVNNNLIRDNVIGHNNEAGIRIVDDYSALNTITNNRIGVALDNTPIPNAVGIIIEGSQNTIGPDNIIARNTSQGIRLVDPIGDRNTITRNSIFNNGTLGIDIDPTGVTPNDPDDADTGPNEQLNFPVLTDASLSSVTGTACGGCTVEVFITDGGDPNGEGRTFIGSGTASPAGDFTVAVSGLSGGQSVTATATDSTGNTSEFSANRTASGPNTPPTAAFTTNCNGLTCTFNGSSSSDNDGTIAGYGWNFGDGSPLDTTSGAIVVHTYASAGDYTATLTVADDDGATDSESDDITVTVPTGPLTIQAEDYVNFHDTTAGNTGGACRNDNVDKQTTTDTGGGCHVGWIANGEWLTYAVNIPTTGSYSITLRLATPNSGRTLRVEVDGVNISGNVAVPNTGGYQNWANKTIGPYNLTAGQHTFRIFFQSNSFNFNYFSISAAQATIQAEDYNQGGQGAGYFDTTPGNAGGKYRNDDVDIQSTTDAGGGFNVGWIATGEWLDYTVDVPETANYTVVFRVASPNNGRSLRLEIDGANIPGTVTIPNTGGFQNWADASLGPFSISEGTRTFTIVALADGFNINHMRLVPS